MQILRLIENASGYIGEIPYAVVRCGVDECVVVVGLHPDETLEHLKREALRMQSALTQAAVVGDNAGT